MLQVFHLDVASVLSGCCNGYTRIFQAYVSSVLSVFSLMLQVFELNVSKINQEKHML
jgi:hypothetical protein